MQPCDKMTMRHHTKYLFLSIVLFFSAGSLLSKLDAQQIITIVQDESGSANTGTGSGLVVVIGINRHLDGEAQFVYEIENATVVKGAAARRKTATVTRKNHEPFNGQGSVVLAMLNAAGETLHLEPLVFPVMMTVPLPEPGQPSDHTPPSIPLAHGSTTVVIPYHADADSLVLFENDRAIFSDTEAFLEIHREAQKKKMPVAPVKAEAGSHDGVLKIMILSSGFSLTQKDDFTNRARGIIDYFMQVEPFLGREKDILFIIHHQTRGLGCHTGCFNIDRLMCCNSGLVVQAAAASGHYPDEVIVVHNTDTYSGGGYREAGDSYRQNSLISYAMVYHGSHTNAMALHEFGHSFGNLCDEYTYGSEGYTYSDCVNCRRNCSDWVGISLACETGCDAEPTFSRPANSIMLSLSYPSYNQPSIKADFFPDGLEKRMDFFIAAKFSITSIAGDGGRIIPSGIVGVRSGSGHFFSIVPDQGYRIGTINVDGIEIDMEADPAWHANRRIYTFTNVERDHVIKANFVPIATWVDEAQEPVVSVYQDPASGFIRLEFNNILQSQARISLYNLQGQVMQQMAISSGGEQVMDLPVKGYSPGVYILSVTGDGLYFVRKLIIGS